MQRLPIEVVFWLATAGFVGISELLLRGESVATGQRCVDRAERRLLLVGLVLFAAAGCDRFDKVGPPSKQIVVAQAQVPHSLLPMVAKKVGSFNGEGLDVIIKEFATGDDSLKELLGKRADFATVRDVDVMRACLAGEPVLVVATIMRSPVSTKILARRDKGVDRPRDLRGKALGTLKNSGAEYFLARFLKRNCVPPREVRITRAQPSELVQAIVRGDLAAISLGEPFMFNAICELGDKGLVFTDGSLYVETFHIAVTKEYAESNATSIDNFLRALDVAADVAKADPDTAKRIAAGASSISREAMDHFWLTFRFDLSMHEETVDQIRALAQFQAEMEGGPAGPQEPDYPAIFACEFLRRVCPERVTPR